MRKSDVTFFWRGPVWRWFSRIAALSIGIPLALGCGPRVAPPGISDVIAGLALGALVPLALRRPLIAGVEQGAARELWEGYPDIEIGGTLLAVLAVLAGPSLTVLVWFALQALPGASWPWLASVPDGGPTIALIVSWIVTAEIIGRWYDRLPC